MSTLMMKMQNVQHHIYDCTIHNTDGSAMTRVHINHARTSNELTTRTISANQHPMVSMHGQQSLLIPHHYPTTHPMYFPPYVPPYHPAYSVMGQNANADTQDQNVPSIQQPLSPKLGDHHDEKKENDNTTINI